MRVLVTGGCGFIGSAVTRVFRARGYKVDVVDDMSNGNLQAIGDMPLRVIPADFVSIYQNTQEEKDDQEGLVRVFEGDFSHPLVLNRISQGFYTYVLHLAATPQVQFSVEQPALTMENNVMKTVKLLQAAATGQVKRFIFSSSSAIYGDQYDPGLPAVDEDTPPDPQSPYALQKLTIDMLLPMYHEFHGLDSCALRYFNAYGPGHDGQGAYSTAIAAWCNRIKNGKPMRSDGDGTQSRDLVFVTDIARANLLAAEAEGDLKGRAFNICTGEGLSNNEIMREIWKRAGPHPKVDAPERPGDVKHTLGDYSRAKEFFGYEPEVSFAQGLDLTMQWWGLL